MSDLQFCLQESLLIGSGPLLNSLFSAAPTLVSLVSSVPSQSDHCTSCSATLPCFAQTWLASVGVHWAHGYNPRRRSRWFHIKLHPLASTSIRWSVSQWKHSIGRLCIAFLLLFSPLKRLSVLSVWFLPCLVCGSVQACFLSSLWKSSDRLWVSPLIFLCFLAAWCYF